jgi:hypothetical protein
MDSEGSRRLIRAAYEAGAAATAARGLTAAERRARRRRALKLNLGRNLITGYHGPRWTKKQLALLRRMSDAEVADRTGRTENAVRIMRQRLALQSAAGIVRRPWTASRIATAAVRIELPRGRGADRQNADGGQRQAVDDAGIVIYQLPPNHFLGSSFGLGLALVTRTSARTRVKPL